MFYSHEILTNSQYGVATIWLVATVGKAQKGVNKRAIQNVNVPKACEKIVHPGAPLALRLQGNLLYGVARVHQQQCGYVLVDAEKTQSDMMMFFRGLQTSDTDPQAGKTNSSVAKRLPASIGMTDVGFPGPEVLEYGDGGYIEFDADGNCVFQEPELPPLPAQTGLEASDNTNSVELWRSGTKAFQTADEDVVPPTTGEEVLPDAEAFPVQAATGPVEQAQNVRLIGKAPRNAPIRKRKVLQALDREDRVDREEFRHWDEHYVAIQEHKRRKITATTSARKTAATLIFQNGLNHIGLSLGVLGIVHPLAEEFAGPALSEKLLGVRFGSIGNPQGSRRRKSPSPAHERDDQIQRRVKPRIAEEVEHGRVEFPQGGQQAQFSDDTMPEMGLDVAEAMPDHHSSSAMPWSRAGSVVPGSSARRGGNVQKQMPQPSPLHRHGRISPGIIGLNSDSIDPHLDADDLALLGSDPGSFDLALPFGTQGSDGTLDAASEDFLGYATERALRRGTQRPDDQSNLHWVNFEDLASPDTHNKSVAAQAFLHVLSLATKNVISVRQHSSAEYIFAPIHVGLHASGEPDDNTAEDYIA